MSGAPRTGADGHPHRGELRTSWTMLMACNVGIALGAMSIPTYTIGAFVVPLRREFGWSGPQVQSAILISQIMCGAGAMIAGYLIDRVGLRRLALSGSLGVSAGLLLAAVNPGSFPLFLLAFACLGILGCGSGPVAWTRAIAGRFQRRRGTALAIALSGTGLGGFVLPPLVVATIEGFGWRAGFVLLAALPLLIALPLTGLFFRPTAEAPGTSIDIPTQSQPGVIDAIRSYRFWVMLGSVLCVYLAITGIVPNLIPSLTMSGFPAVQAAIVQSWYAVALILGRLVLGWLVDRFWAPGVAALVLTPAAIGCFLLTRNPDFLMAIAAVTLIGLAAGAELDLLAFLTARYFGLSGFAKTYAMLYLSVTVAAGVGPMIFAWMLERTASVILGFQLAGLLFLVGGPMMLALGRYPSIAPEK